MLKPIPKTFTSQRRFSAEYQRLTHYSNICRQVVIEGKVGPMRAKPSFFENQWTFIHLLCSPTFTKIPTTLLTSTYFRYHKTFNCVSLSYSPVVRYFSLNDLSKSIISLWWFANMLINNGAQATVSTTAQLAMAWTNSVSIGSSPMKQRWWAKDISCRSGATPNWLSGLAINCN